MARTRAEAKTASIPAPRPVTRTFLTRRPYRS
jgi:hypothetical protein